MLIVFCRRCGAWESCNQSYSLNASTCTQPLGVTSASSVENGCWARALNGHANPLTMNASNALRRLVGRKLGQQRELPLLHLHQLDPFLIADLIELRVERDDFYFCFRVHFEVMLGIQPIMSRLTVLAHHDDGRLQRGHTGEHQVQEDVRVGVERL